ncbi:MAG: DUF1289 domain-containing protein [Pseudomonadota bacterium]
MTAPIQSPCILVCSIDRESGHCFGCGRTGTEIASWSQYSNEERASLMAILPERVAKLERPERRVTKRERQRRAQGETPSPRTTQF